MDPSQPTLPTNHAFLVQLRAQSPETPWRGRAASSMWSRDR